MSEGLVLYDGHGRVAVDMVTVEPPQLEEGRLMADGLSPMAKMQLLDVEAQEEILSEYDKRRDHFFRWLLSKMKQGIHFGFPPGTGQRTNPKEWTAKPSLYQAGAVLLVDVLQLHPRFKLDTETWEMLGKPPGVICWTCALKVRGSHKVVGTGHGTCAPGSHPKDPKTDPHSRVLIAKKRALVNAVRDGVPVVSELFTADLEDNVIEKDAVEPFKEGNPAQQPEVMASPSQRKELESLADHEWLDAKGQDYCAASAANKELTAKAAARIIERAKVAATKAKTEAAESPHLQDAKDDPVYPDVPDDDPEPDIGEPPEGIEPEPLDDDSEREPGEEG